MINIEFFFVSCYNPQEFLFQLQLTHKARSNNPQSINYKNKSIENIFNQWSKVNCFEYSINLFFKFFSIWVQLQYHFNSVYNYFINLLIKVNIIVIYYYFNNIILEHIIFVKNALLLLRNKIIYNIYFVLIYHWLSANDSSNWLILLLLALLIILHTNN